VHLSSANIIRRFTSGTGSARRRMDCPAKRGHCIGRLTGTCPQAPHVGGSRAQYERGFLCSHSVRHCVPGSPSTYSGREPRRRGSNGSALPARPSGVGGSSMGKTALQGIKVVDFSWALPGPLLEPIWAIMGAGHQSESHSRWISPVTLPTKMESRASTVQGLLVVNIAIGITLNLRHPRASDHRKAYCLADVLLKTWAGVMERLDWL